MVPGFCNYFEFIVQNILNIKFDNIRMKSTMKKGGYYFETPTAIR
jgi:hypothetical protein